MTIDERFSKQAFEALGWASEESRVLCGQLDAEIHEMLRHLLVPAVREIVGRLNAMGHALVDFAPDGGDNIHYREPCVTASPIADYTMILAVDWVITVGYPELPRFVPLEADDLV